MQLIISSNDILHFLRIKCALFSRLFITCSHVKLVNKDDTSNVHKNKYSHMFDWKNPVSDFECDCFKRSVSEILYIKINKCSINRKEDIAELRTFDGSEREVKNRGTPLTPRFLKPLSARPELVIFAIVLSFSQNLIR